MRSRGWRYDENLRHRHDPWHPPPRGRTDLGASRDFAMVEPAGAPHQDGKQELPAEVLPKAYGKYTLLRRLASGGMAELFLALQRSVAGFEKLIVIKRILP